MLGRGAELASWRAGALLAVMVLASVLRSWGVLSGELVWHPDEILFSVTLPLCLLAGDLNPHFFTYPTFHLYQLGVVYFLQYLLAAPDSLESWVATRLVWEPELTRDTARWIGVLYSVCVVGATALLAGRLSGHRTPGAALTSPAGLTAALLAAVNVLLVRQAPIAGVDTPLAFWFAVTVFVSMHILDGASWREYAITGGLVGVCAATKYPGAVVAVAVLTSHLLAGRSIGDRRIWAAGGISIITFLSLAPHTLIDFGSFRVYFLEQIQHASEGRWGLRFDPLYQLTHTLRYGTGTLAWLGWLLTGGWVLWKRPRAHLVVLTATLTGYAVVSWGDLVFARYVLPLVPLQLALIADGIVRGSRYLEGVGRLPHRFMVPAASTIALILAIQPAYGAWQVARLQGTPDTRTEARAWIESNVPPGSTLCNFGGWAGDPQVNTFVHLWWRFTKYTTAYGGQDLEALRRADLPGDAPYYFYAVQTTNEDQAKGSIALIHSRECSHVILHEHPLPYSSIDTLELQRLKAEARRVATFDPGRTDASVFDPMDAYYIPLVGWDVSTPGPRIEVWDVHQYRTQGPAQSVSSLLSLALSMGAETKADEGDHVGARVDVDRALSLEPRNTQALGVLAGIERDMGDLQAAASAYRKILQMDPEDSPALKGMANLSVQRGNHARAIDWYNRARRQGPSDASLLNSLAFSHRVVGHPDRARGLWLRALSFEDDHADAHFNLGTALYLDGEPAQALPHLRRAVELAPDRFLPQNPRFCPSGGVRIRGIFRYFSSFDTLM